VRLKKVFRRSEAQTKKEEAFHGGKKEGGVKKLVREFIGNLSNTLLHMNSRRTLDKTRLPKNQTRREKENEASNGKKGKETHHQKTTLKEYHH